jgi:hypothetical protein
MSVRCRVHVGLFVAICGAWSVGCAGAAGGTPPSTSRHTEDAAGAFSGEAGPTPEEPAMPVRPRLTHTVSLGQSGAAWTQQSSAASASEGAPPLHASTSAGRRDLFAEDASHAPLRARPFFRVPTRGPFGHFRGYAPQGGVPAVGGN